MMTWINLILLAVVIGLNVADAVLTWLCLRAGGYELNKVIAWLIDKVGTVPALAVVKMLLIGVLLVVFYFSWQTWYLTILLALASAGYVLVVVNNWRAWRKLSATGTSSA